MYMYIYIYIYNLTLAITTGTSSFSASFNSCSPYSSAPSSSDSSFASTITFAKTSHVGASTRQWEHLREPKTHCFTLLQPVVSVLLMIMSKSKLKLNPSPKKNYETYNEKKLATMQRNQQIKDHFPSLHIERSLYQAK